ncbi:Multi antimicrobial extrusion protein [Corchorus olitorius]|uniref:Protein DETOXIFICATION n=1 Tax=Corchorus olitorius TaxID=93759 RepID=A0A1R3GT56_9ROSI|nr:Multi antimicrobial extrusion protein [Corchorus olitorius]
MDEKLLVGLNQTKNGGELKERVWVELKKIWRTAFPASLTKLTSFGMFVITQAFIGHLSKVELAAYSLIQIITVRFAYGILLGMSSATETLCGQAFGAKQYHMMGIYLQRSWIINFGAQTVLLPIFIFASPILKFLGEEEDVANQAGYISLWFIPVLYAFLFNVTVQKYLQAQLKNMIIGWLSAISFVLHVLFSWIFVSKLNWGIPGAMTSMIITNWFVVFGEIVYIFGGWCPKTWKGFTIDCFADLFPVLKLSISSAVMICLELWYYAVLVLLAGYMPNATTAISAFSICLNIIAWEFMLCLGFFSSASVRVSNELGNGNAKAAKFSMKVNVSASLLLGVIFWALCLIFSHRIGYLFSNDEEVVKSVLDLSVLLSFSVFLNRGAVGAGRQSIVAYVNTCSFYLVGVPLGVLLGYLFHLQVKGIWIGMIIGVVMQTVTLGYLTWKTDWDEQVKIATERLNRWLLRSSEES